MTTKYKWKFTIAKRDVDEDTAARVRIHAERIGAEFLGLRKRKNGDIEFGVCADVKLYGKFKNLLAKFVSFSCEQFDMDGKPIEVGEAYSKPKPKAKTKVKELKPEPNVQAASQMQEAKTEREPVCPGIPPIMEQFKNWDDIGSPAHERGVKLLGAGCEVGQMKWWGKFSIDRHHLYSVLYSRLKDDAEFKKYTEANMCRPKGFAEYVATNWDKMRPFVYKAFSKDDAEFIEWHTTHKGRSPS